MDSHGLPLRKLATVLGVGRPFLSQIRAGKQPIPETPEKVEALDAYQLLITDKQLQKRAIGGNDWVRTSGLALMKRPLYR